MPLTPEAKREISRANGKRSRGPTTELGKSRSRRNALKHGLCAQTVPLPNEDPAAIAARAAAWADYYQPSSPAAHHLVNQCVRATLLADRCHQVHDSVVADQVDAAALRWERDRQEQVEALRLQLATDPAAAVAGLERTGHGCRWLIGCWEELARSLEANGCWSPNYGEYAVRLLGCRPDPEALRHKVWAYLLFLFHLRSQPTPPEELIAVLTQPDFQPDDLRACAPGELSSAPTFCRDWLRQRVAEHLEQLRAVEQELRTGPDATARSRALDRAMVLEDENQARLFFRYHAESRSTFHRALKELFVTLKRDAESPDEPDPAPFADGSSRNEPGAPVSRNEPDDHPEVLDSPGDRDGGPCPPDAGPAPSPSPDGPATDPDPARSRNEPDDAGRPDAPGSRNEPGTAAARPEPVSGEATGSVAQPAPRTGPVWGGPDQYRWAMRPDQRMVPPSPESTGPGHERRLWDGPPPQ